MMALADHDLAEALKNERAENARKIVEKAESIGQQYL
jgi:hypothetical protein